MATHHFEPTHYHTTIGSHEPVLRIADGDTVDHHDASMPAGTTRSGEAGHAGRQPADRPVLRRGRRAGRHAGRAASTASRRTATIGCTGTVVAANVVDPVVRAASCPRAPTADWRTIDLERGTADARTRRTGRSSAQLSCRSTPMLGCFGVAPAARPGDLDRDLRPSTAATWTTAASRRASRSTSRSSSPGALFHVGDGHAIQGDGEIVGTGIEISFDVQFTVELLKGKRSRWPRGENADYIFTVGNARPLDQAVQHATTEMLRWLAAGLRARLPRRSASCSASASATTSATSSTRPTRWSRRSRRRCSRGCDARLGSGARRLLLRRVRRAGVDALRGRAHARAEPGRPPRPAPSLRQAPATGCSRSARAPGTSRSSSRGSARRSASSICRPDSSS